MSVIVGKVGIELFPNEDKICMISMHVYHGWNVSLYMFAVCDLMLKNGTMCFESERDMLTQWRDIVVQNLNCQLFENNNEYFYLYTRCKALGIF